MRSATGLVAETALHRQCRRDEGKQYLEFEAAATTAARS